MHLAVTLEPGDYLQPDETVLFSTRPRMASLWPGTIGWLLVLAVLLTGLAVAKAIWWTDLPSWVLPAAIAAAAVVWLGSTAAEAIRLRTSRYVITDQRLYRSHGRLRFQLVQTTYDKLTDIHVAQGPFGRAAGYGSLTANTAGAALALPGLPGPFEVKQRLEEARSAFLRRLVAAHKRKPAAAAGATETPRAKAAGKVDGGRSPLEAASHGTVVWTGSPSVQSMVGRLVSASAMVLAGTVLLGLAFAGVPGSPWLGGALLLVGLGSAASAVIAYRYSRYQVTAIGVVVSAGWLSRRRVETTFGKVTDVTTTQTVLGRLLGYGDIRINTAGSNDVAVAFAGVARPQEVKAIIDDARGARP